MTILPPVEIGYILDPARPIIPFTLDVCQAVCHAPHHHPRGQVIYAGQGVMRVVCNNDVWLIPPMQAVWVPPNVEHMVYFPGQVTLRNLFIDPAAVSGMPEKCTVFEVTPLLRELITKAISIGNTYAPEGSEIRLMQVILDELGQARETPLHLPMAHSERLRRVMEALLNNPGDTRPLEYWAETACTSSRTLARLFVHETGMTFGVWRQQLRLIEAIQRLDKGARVTQVAFDLGYGSLSAFIEMFRKRLGCPPGKYL